ncbi:hypothetical protein MHBO_002420, partial [Bonamia ostreae]
MSQLLLKTFLSLFSDFPDHIAFILDGNRRFALKNGMSKIDGHKKGFNNLINLEIDYLMKMLNDKIDLKGNFIWNDQSLAKNFNNKNAGIRFIGDFSKCPKNLQRKLKMANENCGKTKFDILLNVCFSYCSDDEATFASLKLKNGFFANRT